MKNINLKQGIVNLKGIVMKSPDGDYTVGQALSSIILETKEGGKMKLFVLAQKCFTDETLVVDAGDFSLIKSAVEHSVDVLIAGQLLVMLDGLKEETK